VRQNSSADSYSAKCLWFYVAWCYCLWRSLSPGTWHL